MSLNKFVQELEKGFWKMFIPLLSGEGKLMKTIRTTKQATDRQWGNFIFLIFIWAAIGFVSGMLIGKVLLILQLL